MMVLETFEVNYEDISLQNEGKNLCAVSTQAMLGCPESSRMDVRI